MGGLEACRQGAHHLKRKKGAILLQQEGGKYSFHGTAERTALINNNTEKSKNI